MHDPFCPLAAGRLADTGPLAYCQCGLIARVRADEARSMKESAVNVAVAGFDLAVDEHREHLREKVEALPGDGSRPSMWVRRADVLALLSV